MEKFPSNFEKEGKTKIAPEFLKSVEESKLVIDDKVNLLLTKVGVKPASEIKLIIKSWYKGEETEYMNKGKSLINYYTNSSQ